MLNNIFIGFVSPHGHSRVHSRSAKICSMVLHLVVALLVVDLYATNPISVEVSISAHAEFCQTVTCKLSNSDHRLHSLGRDRDSEDLLDELAGRLSTGTLDAAYHG